MAIALKKHRFVNRHDEAPRVMNLQCAVETPPRLLAKVLAFNDIAAIGQNDSPRGLRTFSKAWVMTAFAGFFRLEIVPQPDAILAPDDKKKIR